MTKQLFKIKVEQRIHRTETKTSANTKIMTNVRREQNAAKQYMNLWIELQDVSLQFPKALQAITLIVL